MAGHSKWANIRHRKERSDAKKGKVFSRAAKEIITAVKLGGNDPKTNMRLKVAVQKAKEASVPNDVIERNIKKAVEHADYMEVTYELYGHGGVGLIVDTMTDNKNRIASEIRIAINKCGGSIATPGAVAFNFERKGLIEVPKEEMSEEELFRLALEAGAEEFEVQDGTYLITTETQSLYQVKEALHAGGVKKCTASLEVIPLNMVDVDPENKKANLELIEWLEGIDDVDAVYHNMNENE